MDVITTNNPNDEHGHTSQLTATEKQQLVAYLQQIDNIARTDYDADGDVDQSDFGFLQLCFTGPPGPTPPGCDGRSGSESTHRQRRLQHIQILRDRPDQPTNLNCAD